MADNLTTLAKRLIPLIKRIVQETVVSQTTPAPFNLTAGNGIAINGVEISAVAGTLITVNAAGINLSNGSAQYQAPITGATPFTPAWTALSTLAGNGLTFSAGYQVGAGAGITVNADDVALTTPGTLTVATTNSSTGSHTHAITSSASPGAAASILASDANGFLQLVRLGCGIAPTAPLDVLYTSDVSVLIRSHSDTDELTLLRLDKRTAAGTGGKRWDLMIDDTTGDLRIRPVDANDYFKISNLDSSLNSLLIDTNIGQTVLNQGANDGELLSLKSSDVAHGITDQTETDTYGLFKKMDIAAGGLIVRGVTEDIYGLSLDGFVTNGITTKSTAGLGAINIRGYKKSGTNVGSMGADENILAVRNANSTVMLLDEDGDMMLIGNMLVGTFTDGMTAAGSLAIAQDLAHRGSYVGFYNVTPVTRPQQLRPTMTVSGTADATYGAEEGTMINELILDMTNAYTWLGQITDKLQAVGLLST